MPLDNSIGGAGATPGSVTGVNSNSTSLVNGAGDVVDAVTVSGTVATVGVWFEVTVTRAQWNDAAGIVAAGAGGAGVSTTVGELVSEYAALIEALALLQPVTAISYQRNTNAQTLLIGQLLVTVSTPDGQSNIDVTVPFDPAQEAASNNAILAAYAGIATVAAAA